MLKVPTLLLLYTDLQRTLLIRLILYELWQLAIYSVAECEVFYDILNKLARERAYKLKHINITTKNH